MNRVFVILLLLPCAMWAQDVHFTQWMHNPLFTNPAATVFFFFYGEYKIQGQQRSQWASVSIPLQAHL